MSAFIDGVRLSKVLSIIPPWLKVSPFYKQRSTFGKSNKIKSAISACPFKCEQVYKT